MLIAPSKYQKDFYVANGFEKKKIKINKNGVMPPTSCGIKKMSDKVRFAYLGGNARHKGYNWIKKIFESIDHSDYSLNLADCQRKSRNLQRGNSRCFRYAGSGSYEGLAA